MNERARETDQKKVHVSSEKSNFDSIAERVFEDMTMICFISSDTLGYLLTDENRSEVSFETSTMKHRIKQIYTQPPDEVACQ